MWGPCAVPSFCKKFWWLNLELLQVKQISKASTIHWVESRSKLLSSKTSLTFFKQDLWSIFGNILTTLKLTRTWLSVKTDSIILSKVLENFIPIYVRSCRYKWRTFWKQRHLFHRQDSTWQVNGVLIRGILLYLLYIFFLPNCITCTFFFFLV